MMDDDAWRRRRAEELHGTDTLARYLPEAKLPAGDVLPLARPPIRVEPPSPPVVPTPTPRPARSWRLAAIGLAVLLVIAALFAWRSRSPEPTLVPARVEPPVVRVPQAVVEPPPVLPAYTAPPPPVVAPPMVAKSQPAAKPRPTAVRRPSPKPPRSRAARVAAATSVAAEASFPALPPAGDPVAATVAEPVAAAPAAPRFALPVCKGYQLYRPMTPCRAPGRRE